MGIVIVNSALKSDVVAEKRSIRLRIDAKYTLSKDKITVQKETMEKIDEEAEEGEVPLVVFSFYNHRILYALIKKELLNYQGKIHEKKGWKNRKKYIEALLELKEKEEVAPEEFFEMIQEYYRASKC